MALVAGPVALSLEASAPPGYRNRRRPGRAVCRHRLSKHTEERVFLRQAVAKILPSLAAVARPPDRSQAWHVTTTDVTVGKDKASRITRMDGWKAET